MNTTTTPIHNILDVLHISYLQYDNFREMHYQNYCNLLASKFFLSYKMLHSHDLMQNYFHDMWLIHVERAFMLDNQQYFGLCEPKLLRSLFHEYTKNVIDADKAQMYPLPLIKAIRKRNLQKQVN